MIVQKKFKTRKDGVKLFKTYSDQKMMIRQVSTGRLYDAAIDPEDKLSERQYEETETPINAENA